MLLQVAAPGTPLPTSPHGRRLAGEFLCVLGWKERYLLPGSLRSPLQRPRVEEKGLGWTTTSILLPTHSYPGHSWAAMAGISVLSLPEIHAS